MDYIKIFDLFEVKFHFYLNNQPNYQNLFGGIMSFLFCILCIFFFILFSYDELKRLNPISSKSEIPDGGLRTVNVLKERIWIPFRMVTYEEQFVDHRGILFPQIYYIEGKWNNTHGMDLTYHLLNYKLCNETSMANKPDSFKINVPLNELFCIDNDDLPFGGSWNGNYLYFLEYNLHLCQDGINFNDTDPRCTKMNDLLAHRNTSWLFEFYYPVVQFQPTNYDVPLAVIYRSYFYRLASNSNKVERIYINEHILSDDKNLLNVKNKNSSCWGMSLLYGDDYFSKYEFDPIVKSTSSRIYSLDIYMDQGIVFYTRSYKKFLLIVSDFFPLLKVLLFVLKKCTQHIKISESKRKLTGLFFENISLEQKRRMSIINQITNKIKLESMFNNKKELQKDKDKSNEENKICDNQEYTNENNKSLKKQKVKNFLGLEKNNIFPNPKSDNNIYKINLINNKSQMPLNDDNLMNILNKQDISKINSNKKIKPIFYKSSKTNNFRNKLKIGKINLKYKEELFPYMYFFLDLFFDKMTNPQIFCCVSHKYFTIYNFMSKIYDISTYLMVFKHLNLLHRYIIENVNTNNKLLPFERNMKINLNDQNALDQIDKDLKNRKNLLFSDLFSKQYSTNYN